MGRMGFLPVLLCSLLAWAPSAMGGVIKVETAEDGPGSCPGAKCNLRAAWGLAELGDTILLTVDPVMTQGPLAKPTWVTATTNGTVTLMGPENGGAVVRGGSTPVIAISSYPYTPSQFVRLVIQNIEFTGFHIPSNGNPGMVICISPSDNYCEHPLMEEEREYRKARPAPHSEPPLGAQTKWGNWSDLRKRPGLELENVVFRNNSCVSTVRSVCSVVSINLPPCMSEPCTHPLSMPVIMTDSQFSDNTVTGDRACTGVVVSAFGGSEEDYYSATPMIVSGCRFAGNRDLTTAPMNVEPAFQGTIFTTIGPISIQGSSFVGNTMGPSRALITTGFSHYPPSHVYVYDTYFAANVGNLQNANSIASTIICSGWIILHRVTIDIPASVVPSATISNDDQYMESCAIRSESGEAVSVDGYQIFNREPLFTNLTSAGSVAGYGFAVSAPHPPEHGINGFTQIDPWFSDFFSLTTPTHP